MCNAIIAISWESEARMWTKLSGIITYHIASDYLIRSNKNTSKEELLLNLKTLEYYMYEVGNDL